MRLLMVKVKVLPVQFQTSPISKSPNSQPATLTAPQVLSPALKSGPTLPPPSKSGTIIEGASSLASSTPLLHIYTNFIQILPFLTRFDDQEAFLHPPQTLPRHALRCLDAYNAASPGRIILPSQFKCPIHEFVNPNGAPVVMSFGAGPFERQLPNCNASI
ncbi:hypothetical protein CROQUDRAFT_97568 [Cronartium quercuum f. sp. fusiforme G11]|uniref:Uncharacterized protein n=1 Tax=Cronartium quercuum f. sp. fusiforme G11 TaxID=708437 RepID=A0A9P6N9E4_9BASI|nr:hypothetical protein CROQUDRAFT_97568 [Cronartium quercuum f. sp. fusiforme G11]